MDGNAKLRASDADRDRVAAALREHLAAGRLTTEEFNDRLEQAFAAKTLGDLQGLMADLPGTELDQIDDSAMQRPTAGQVDERLDRLGSAWQTMWRPWLAITLFFFVLWLVSGATGGPWFVYPALVAGIVLLRRRRGPPRRRGDQQVGSHEHHEELGG